MSTTVEEMMRAKIAEEAAMSPTHKLALQILMGLDAGRRDDNSHVRVYATPGSVAALYGDFDMYRVAETVMEHLYAERKKLQDENDQLREELRTRNTVIDKLCDSATGL